MNALETALALARIGLHVFPVQRDTKRPYENTRGHIDASADPDVVTRLFKGRENAWPAVNAGNSNLVTLDLDRKHGVDGFMSVQSEWLEVPPTFSYDTPNSGSHYIYRAPDGVRLNGQVNYRGLPGVDRRGGSSYFVWWGKIVPDSFDLFREAPEWLCDPAEEKAGAQFDGGLDKWLSTVLDGEPDETVQAAIDRIPRGEFGHPEMIERQFELVRLAAEGRRGVSQAIATLRSEWLRGEYNTLNNEYDFDSGLDSAVRRFGALDETLADLPDYSDTLQLLPDDFDVSQHLFRESSTRRAYFDTLRALAETDLDEKQIAALLWGAPATRDLASAWGAPYFREQLAKAREGGIFVDPESDEPFIPGLVEHISRVSLLTDSEREYLTTDFCWIDRYVQYVKGLSSYHNEPYTRANAWTVLSTALGRCALIDTPDGVVPTNLYQLTLGESSTGKTAGLRVRDSLLRAFFHQDSGYEKSGDMSVEGLAEQLLKRDGLSTLVNIDEAAQFFSELQTKTNLRPLPAYLARAYDGVAPPRHTKGAEATKWATTSLTISMYGTPDRVLDLLDDNMILDGVLARYVFTFGNPPDKELRAKFSRGKRRPVDDSLPTPLANFVLELHDVRQQLGGKYIYEDNGAFDRLEEVKSAIFQMVDRHAKSKLLDPIAMRLSDSVRKAAALLAMAEGLLEVQERHVLHAIAQAEEWLAAAFRFVENMSASRFSRECDEIYLYVVSRGGKVTKKTLFTQFRRYTAKDIMERIQSLELQGRIKLSHKDTSYMVVG